MTARVVPRERGILRDMDTILDAGSVVYRRAFGRVGAALVAIVAMIGALVVLAAPAYAESYGTSISASASSVPAGSSVTLYASNDSSGDAAITICRGDSPGASPWDGVAIAENGSVAPGGSISHPVSESSGYWRFAAFAGPGGPHCDYGADSATSVTWTSSYAPPTTTTTTTTTPPVQKTYSVYGYASNSSPKIDTDIAITAHNTSSNSEWLMVCTGFNVAPIAAGWHAPGTNLVDSHVTSSTGGYHTYYLFANASDVCAGAHHLVTVDWANTTSISVSPTNVGTDRAPGTDVTTVTWDGAEPGSTIRVELLTSNGTTEDTTAGTHSPGYSGTWAFSQTKTVYDNGHSLNNVYQAQLVTNGTVESEEDFTFSWGVTTCINPPIYLSVSSSGTGLTGEIEKGQCIPFGKDELSLYWSATPPSGKTLNPLYSILLGSVQVGTGPEDLPVMVQHTWYPSSPHNVGYFEMYLVKDSDQTLVSCSSVVHLKTRAVNHYDLNWGASSLDPTVGSVVTLTGLNSNPSGSNGEWIAYCGTTGTDDQGSGWKYVGQSLTHPVTSSVPGDVTYYARAASSSTCSSGTEKSVTVTWRAKSTPPGTGTPAYALIATAANLAPTIGQSDTIVLTNETDHSEDLSYCGTSGTGSPVADGTHGAGGQLTYEVSSPSSAMDITYVGYASGGYGCSGAEASVTVDWQPAPSSTTTVPTTTTTTTVPTGTTPPAGNSGTTTTTTQPTGTTTTQPTNTTTTTVPPATAPTPTSPGTWYPT